MIQTRLSLSPVARLSLAIVISALLVLGLATHSFAAEHTCNSVQVAVFPERIHVRCDVATSDGIEFFAVATTNAAHVARILSVLTMAHVTGRSIIVAFEPTDTSGTAFGCLANDCRRLLYVVVLE